MKPTSLQILLTVSVLAMTDAAVLKRDCNTNDYSGEGGGRAYTNSYSGCGLGRGELEGRGSSSENYGGNGGGSSREVGEEMTATECRNWLTDINRSIPNIRK
ncbi:hypothetical protein K7432_015500 [Basidiobolus ranarum]|uniref:Uncharacterized protein n=1 Tax=Basidiobolus ranarum TaxID=34480 RepID=A0ABR2WG25_9FUNG